MEAEEDKPLLGDDPEKDKPKEGKRGVNALQLTMMIYFFTSGREGEFFWGFMYVS
jgi:hypothetical protein